MVNLMGVNAFQLTWFDAANAKEQEKVDGIKMHGGMSETSSMLYIVPHLVDTNYKQAIPYAGEDMQALIQIAKSPQWQGYFGSEKSICCLWRGSLEIKCERLFEVCLRHSQQ